MVADMPAIIVLAATMPMRPSDPASELPALNPNQLEGQDEGAHLDHRMWWGRIGLTLPSARTADARPIR